MLLNILIILFFHTVYCYLSDWEANRTNYTILEITAFNTRERAELYRMQITDDNVVFLNGVTNIVSSPIYAMVSDCCTKSFKKKLEGNGIEYVQVLKDSV